MNIEDHHEDRSQGKSTFLAKCRGAALVLCAHLSIFLPEFLPIQITWDTGGVSFSRLVPVLFYLEMCLVTFMYIWPFYTDVQDDFEVGEDNTFAKALWTGPYSFIAIVTTGLCLLTWSFGWIRPEWCSHRSSIQYGLYWAHRTAAIVRLLVGFAFFLLLGYQLTLIFIWGPYQLVCQWTTMMLLISGLHMTLAQRRYTNFHDDDRVIFAHSELEMRRPEFDATTSLKMELNSPVQRTTRQIQAQTRVAQKNSGALWEAVWHHPLNMIDTGDISFYTKIGPAWWFKITQAFERLTSGSICVIQDQDRSDLFTRCSCCIGALPNASSLEVASRQSLQRREWAVLRHEYLQRPAGHLQSATTGLGTYTNSTAGASSTTQLNQLCTKCNALCGTSTLLDLAGGYSTRRLLKYLRYAVSPRPLMHETFAHWPTFPKLLEEAQKGCHLCNLMLDMLSLDQRTELIELDARLGQELSRPANASSRHRRTIAARRTVYITIQDPQHVAWSRSQTRPITPEVSVLLVPHFGHANVPRRWTSLGAVERALSVNKDPGMDWHAEHADPIEIRRTKFRSTGPICLSTQSSTASPESLTNLVRPWLDGHQHHTHRSHLQKTLPTRLIDISSTNSALDQNVHIIRTAKFQQKGHQIEYAALSYCWREKETTVLTANPGDVIEIGISKLAPSIQDAIWVARTLKARYLWIDALCIQQDSPADFAAELAKMSDIYSNAEFVISAVAAPDSSKNFIKERNPLAINPCLIGVHDYKAKGGIKPGLLAGIFAVPSKKYTEGVEEEIVLSRLSSRGWVFQEERLPQRTLSFTKHQIVLQCNICNSRIRELDWESVIPWSKSQRYNLLRPDIVANCWNLLLTFLPRKAVKDFRKRWQRFVQILSASKPWSVKRPSIGESDSPTTDFYSQLQESSEDLQTKIWYELVEAYTLRCLSKESDRLAAIQGLADRLERELLHRATGSVRLYYQGIFDSWTSLVPSLLWYASSGNKVSRPSTPAPSWSWASIQGSVKNNSILMSPMPKKCEIEIIEGPVKSNGLVRLYGKVRLASWRPAKPDESPEYYIGHRQVCGLNDPHYHDQFFPVTNDPTDGPEAHALCDTTGRKLGYFVPDTNEMLPSSGTDGSGTVNGRGGSNQILCLSIIARPRDDAAEQDFSVPWAVRGLALVRCQAGTDRYRRVGYFELHREHPGMEVFPSSPTKGRNRRVRPYPVVDPHRFFTDCAMSTVEIA